jgi:phosphoglycolate/pyridoxal phosphate phosphatase family enzyme
MTYRFERPVLSRTGLVAMCLIGGSGASPDDKGGDVMMGFILDMDGVLYRGGFGLPGANEALARLREVGPVVFLTNNSTRTREGFAARASELGLDVEGRDVITSAYATARTLAGSVTRCYVVGEEGIVEELRGVGIEPIQSLNGIEPSTVDAVVVGLDRGISYDRLADASLCIRSGALLVATNPDRTLPIQGREVPGAGTMVAAVEAASGVKARVIGKPQPEAVRMAADHIGLLAEECVVVGDRLDTDIAGGNRAGCTTCLVLTGVSTEADASQAEHPFRPDRIFPTIIDLARSLPWPITGGNR